MQRTPANPNPPLGDPDDLRALPTHESPWQQTGHRDENARLLVDAIYRHRVTLMRRHADVPVQGYEVLSVLASLGETLLSPDYYGFVVAMPDVMQRWSNPVIGRAAALQFPDDQPGDGGVFPSAAR